MSLLDQLNNDLKDAMRSGNEARKLAIRSVKSAITYAEVEKMSPLDDVEMLAVLAKQAKQRRESILEFQRGRRPDLVAKEEAELAVLETYLPHQLSEAEIEAHVHGVLDAQKAAGQADLGSVMRRVMADLKGRADGRLVNQIVRRLLEQG